MITDVSVERELVVWIQLVIVVKGQIIATKASLRPAQ